MLAMFIYIHLSRLVPISLYNIRFQYRPCTNLVYKYKSMSCKNPEDRAWYFHQHWSQLINSSDYIRQVDKYSPLNSTQQMFSNVDVKKDLVEKEQKRYHHKTMKQRKVTPTSRVKPTESYISLIANAILTSEEKRLVLSDIYKHVMARYSYFKAEEKSWRNSIRHNLSLNDCFIKDGRSALGKGQYWAIHPENFEEFSKGDFRRRRARRKNSKKVVSNQKEESHVDSAKDKNKLKSEESISYINLNSHSNKYRVKERPVCEKTLSSDFEKTSILSDYRPKAEYKTETLFNSSTNKNIDNSCRKSKRSS